MMQEMQTQIQDRATVIIGELTEKYAQTIQPEGTDPLVEIRKQELAIKGAESQRKLKFEQKQERKRKRKNQRLVDQQRIDISEEALDKTRIAEERIQAQKILLMPTTIGETNW